MTSSEVDDESLVEQLLTLGRTQTDAIQHFVNDYGNVSLGTDDPRHPANWPESQRQQMRQDAETLGKLSTAMRNIVQELVDRRLNA